MEAVKQLEQVAVLLKTVELTNIADKLRNLIWEKDLAEFTWLQRFLLKSVRLMCRVGRDIWEGQLTLRALSLVYTTLLSLIPLLAISFSVLKGFGVHREIESFLITYLAPFGERADEIAAQLVTYIDNTNVSVLGYVGFALLFYTIISLLQKIEKAFNYVWHVTRHRSIMLRVRDYLVILIIGPTLMFIATGIWTSILGTDVIERVARIQPLGWLLQAFTHALPVLLVTIAFSFIYTLVPNATVRWRAAITGGVVAGILWNIGGVAFAVFVGRSANYPAIYSGFATAMFFMIWLYISWMILLVGASISYYMQNPASASQMQGAFAISNVLKEKLALAIVIVIGRRFYSDKPQLTSSQLTEHLHVPPSATDHVLGALVEGDILIRAGNGDPMYLPAHAWDTLSVGDVMNCVRSFGDISATDISTLMDDSFGEIWDRTSGSRIANDVFLKDLFLDASRTDHALV